MPFTDSLRFVEVARVDQMTLTAKPENVENGKTYVGTTRKLEVGTLPLHEDHGDITLFAGEQYKVPYGKVPKDYYVISKPLSEQTPGTATADKILTPYTAIINGETVTGTMPDNPPENVQLDAGEEYNIPIGYHDGTAVISATDLATQTPGNATADDIVSGKLAWVNGVQIPGAIPEIIQDIPVQLNAGESYTIPYGKHSGTGIVQSSPLDVQTEGTAESDDIADGETAWVNGEQVMGTIPRIAAQTLNFPFNGEYTIPYGIHSGLGKLTQNVPIIEDQVVIAPAFEPQTIEVAGKFMAEDIYVPGIDALNYFRPTEVYCIDQTFTMAATGAGTPVIGSAKLEVDNWHDHYTLNVYKIEVTVIDNGNTYTLNGNVVIDWDNPNAALSTLKTVIGDITIEVALSLEADTNAHTFTCTYTNATGTPNGSITMKVTELFRARQFGDDHDITDPPTLLSGPDFNTKLKTLTTNGVTGFSVTQIPPTDINAAVLVSSDDSLSEAYLYVSNNVLYLYTEATSVSVPADASNMFKDANISGTIDVSKFTFDPVQNMTSTFENSGATTITFANNTNTSNVTTFASTFASNEELTTINGSIDVSNKCTSLASMFYYAEHLTILPETLGMDSWDTSGVTDFSNFVNYCGVWESNNDASSINNFNYSSATNMDSMFEYSIFKNMNTTSWNLDNVVSMNNWMFGSTFTSIILNFANTTFAKLESMDSAFCSVTGPQGFVFKENSFPVIENMKDAFNAADIFVNNQSYVFDFANTNGSLYSLEGTFSQSYQDRIMESITVNIGNPNGIQTTKDMLNTADFRNATIGNIFNDSLTDISGMFKFAGDENTGGVLDLTAWGTITPNDSIVVTDMFANMHYTKIKCSQEIHDWIIAKKDTNGFATVEEKVSFTITQDESTVEDLVLFDSSSDPAINLFNQNIKYFDKNTKTFTDAETYFTSWYAEKPVENGGAPVDIYQDSNTIAMYGRDTSSTTDGIILIPENITVYYDTNTYDISKYNYVSISIPGNLSSQYTTDTAIMDIIFNENKYIPSASCTVTDSDGTVTWTWNTSGLTDFIPDNYKK